MGMWSIPSHFAVLLSLMQWMQTNGKQPAETENMVM
jgi:hypothetical protein